MEKLWGPVNGFWFAAYTVPVGDGDRFASYVKVCWSPAQSYWDAHCAFKLFAGEHHQSARVALDSAESVARSAIWRVPTAARAAAAQPRQATKPLPRRWINAFLRHGLG